MPVATDQPKVGDIVTARFPRREGPSEHPRPCLVLEATDDELLLAYGTTSETDANRGLDLSVANDPDTNGLHRPTRFVCARRVRLSRTDHRLVSDRHGHLVVGTLGDESRPRLDHILRLISEEGPRDEREARERAGLHPGPKRGFLRQKRRRAKGWADAGPGAAARSVVVVTRPRQWTHAEGVSHNH